jgi:hypothetical protein
MRFSTAVFLLTGFYVIFLLTSGNIVYWFYQNLGIANNVV